MKTKKQSENQNAASGYPLLGDGAADIKGESMRTQDIKIGKTYRHRSNPSIGYAKVVKIIKPMAAYKMKNAGYDENEMKIKTTAVKCEWTTDKDDRFGFIKYFRPCDLVEDN